MDNKFKQMYRIQTDDVSKSAVLSRQSPVKRVIISNVGKVSFNPDDRQYIYFSRTHKHHVYYIFNKVIKIIVEEVNKFNHTKGHKVLDLPQKIYPHNFYLNVNANIIKKVKEFFNDYLPPISVELVTLKYLNSFGDFFEKCATTNKHKRFSYTPEISDTNNFGGAYGVNDSWLKLLKCCLISTSSASLDIDKFFDAVLEKAYRGTAYRTTIKAYISRNPAIFDMVEKLTYKEKINPDFKSKNNLNNICLAIEQIYDKHLYSPEIIITKSDILKTKKIIKEDVEMNR